MLSYLHDFHAGGPADVHKHLTLAVVLARLTAKDKPLSYIESHAGAGLYDLEAAEARKTGEALLGVRRLLERGLLPEGHPYRRVLKLIHERHGPDHYPGSPRLAQLLLRPTDHLHLMELHPRAQVALRRHLRGANVHIHDRDGYEGVLAILPPRPRRCLILVDPSYEVKTEYAQAGQFVLDIHRKCPHGVVLLWYPLLRDDLHPPLCRTLEQAALPGFARREVRVADPESPRNLYGSGFLCVNLPYGVEEALVEAEGLVRSMVAGV
ncbi:MAG: 23S rRNA (adenine(2030)-N(6))-methyltransferase RlmJ [Magnetococcales bacterium]|nr:23S rRNA (adenine(2030)-N(6))-methyltransferase RlmJ [Magnetococcales bacterium]